MLTISNHRNHTTGIATSLVLNAKLHQLQSHKNRLTRVECIFLSMQSQS